MLINQHARCWKHLFNKFCAETRMNLYFLVLLMKFRCYIFNCSNICRNSRKVHKKVSFGIVTCTSVSLECISFVSSECSGRVLPNEVYQNCVRAQPESCSARTTFWGSAERRKMAATVFMCSSCGMCFDKMGLFTAHNCTGKRSIQII